MANQKRQAAWKVHPHSRRPLVLEEWSTKWEEIVVGHDLHDLPRAREQLASGWKQYLNMQAGESACGAGAPKPANLATVVLDKWAAGPPT